MKALKPVRFCDYWLTSRRKCNTRGTVQAADRFGAPLFFCRRHWEAAQGGVQYGQVHEVGKAVPA